MTIFDLFFFILAGNKDNHKISNGFEIRQDLTRDLWASCPWASGKIPIDLLWEKCCDHSSTFIFGWIFFILTDNKTNHKSSNEFEFRQDFITDFGVSCPWVSEKLMNNVVITLATSFLIRSSSSEIRNSAGSDQGLMSYLPLSVWKKSVLTYNGRNVATTLVLSFLNGSSFLHTIRTTIKAWMSLNLSRSHHIFLFWS